MNETDRIHQEIWIRAPRGRVWRALTQASQFGQWFRVALDGEFRMGATIRGNILHPGYEHVTMELLIESIDPETYFAYRWHPYAVDPDVDYSHETPTLVEFHLEERDGGTQVSIIESGFDRIPLARRAEAYRMNEGGWAAQAKNLERHVASA